MYHVNPETGNAGKCSATKGKCPFGSAEEHYTSSAAAREAYEEKQKNKIAYEDSITKDYKEYGPESSVFQNWNKVHKDYKLVNDDGKRLVMTLNSKGVTVLTPWHGPKALSDAEELVNRKRYDASWEELMAKDSSYQPTTEPLSAVIARQSVVTDSLRELEEKYGSDVKVDVLTRVTPFGNFLAAVVKAED